MSLQEDLICIHLFTVTPTDCPRSVYGTDGQARVFVLDILLLFELLAVWYALSFVSGLVCFVFRRPGETEKSSVCSVGSFHFFLTVRPN